jgi:deoxycytidine triphosphate deaminase
MGQNEPATFVRLATAKKSVPLLWHDDPLLAERPYGAARGSHYLDQQGPQASRITLDD